MEFPDDARNQDTRWVSGLQIWEAALTFHIRHIRFLWPMLPLLCVPIISDALHTILIVRNGHQNNGSRTQATLQALEAAPELLRMKLFFWGMTGLWALIPIYGWIKEIDYRLAWGMASNVLILEGLKSSDGIDRCWELLQTSEKALAIRALFTFPSIVTFCLLGLLALPGAPLWLWLVSMLWILIPASAAANTYCYLGLLKSTREHSTKNASPSSYKAS